MPLFIDGRNIIINLIKFKLLWKKKQNVQLVDMNTQKQTEAVVVGVERNKGEY